MVRPRRGGKIAVVWGAKGCKHVGERAWETRPPLSPPTLTLQYMESSIQPSGRSHAPPNTSLATLPSSLSSPARAKSNPYTSM